MTVSRNARLAGLVLGLAFASQASLAAESGFYIGVDMGISSLDVTEDELNSLVFDVIQEVGAGGVISNSSLDDSDLAYGLLVGYRFNRNFAAEASYVDLGGASYLANAQITSGVSTIPMDIGINLNPKGPTLSLVWSFLAYDRWTFDARVGAFFSSLDVGISVESGSVQQSDSVGDSSTAVIYGLGAGFAITPAWSVHADYRRYDGISDDLNSDVISVGLRYAIQ